MVAQSTTQISEAGISPRRINRISVSIFFVMHGLAFSTWASRIPTIQSTFHLSVPALGLILFALPLGFFLSLPFAGWLVAKAGSRKATLISSIFYSISLILIGVSTSANLVTASLLSFGFFANALNISMNTQAVEVEGIYQKRLMATFHGLWSLSGFAGAAIGSWMIQQSIMPDVHFTLIAIIVLVCISIASNGLVKSAVIKKEKQPFFVLPDKSMLVLGTIAFCSMIVEGAMFDWTGIYFTDVVKAEQQYTGLGYTTFMIAMATMRFLADGLSGRFGLKRILQVSGLLMGAGLFLAVINPVLSFAIVGFLLIGIGVSSVVPMVYSAAGKSTSMTPGAALTAVSSLGFVGFLIGPPTIGLIAGAITLRGAFLLLIGLAGAVTILSSLIKRH